MTIGVLLLYNEIKRNSISRANKNKKNYLSSLGPIQLISAGIMLIIVGFVLLIAGDL